MGLKTTLTASRGVVLALAGLLFLTGQGWAGSITFLAPRDVKMRQNGASVRAFVKSMTADEILVVLKTGVEKSYPMSTVTAIVAADDTFKYFPAQEGFDKFLERSKSLRGVTIVQDDAPAQDGGGGSSVNPQLIGGVSEEYARIVGMQPVGDPLPTSSGGGFAQVGGFAGASQRPQGLARWETPVIPELDSATVASMEAARKAAELEAATPKFALPGGGVASSPPPTGANGGFALPAASEEVLICSNPVCGKEVKGAKYGDKCPHCGIIWAAQSNADVAAANAPFTPDPNNPFAKAPKAPAPNQAALPAGAVPVPVTVAAPEAGLSLETLPWWGKLLGFGGLIMLLLFLMGRR